MANKLRVTNYKVTLYTVNGYPLILCAMKEKKAVSIILANGSSARFGNEDKLLQQLGKKTVLQHSVDAFLHHSQVGIVLVVSELSVFETIKNSDESSVLWRCGGGLSRYESLDTALGFLHEKSVFENTKVLVHNAANPFVSDSDITMVLEHIKPGTAAAVGHRLHGTVREYDALNVGSGWETLSRKERWELQTPQGALFSDFLKWRTHNADEEITDELMLAEKNGGKIVLLPSSWMNKKITQKEDLAEMRRYIQHEEASIFFGMGIDSHRFDATKEKPCIICGVEVEYTYGFFANSDGDIALHALCNALLSALGKNSFSALADEMCADGVIDSAEYLKKVLEYVSDADMKVVSATCSFEGKYPKIERYFSSFRDSLSEMLDIPKSRIGLNATTGEELDGFGRGEGMKCTALVQLRTDN